VLYSFLLDRSSRVDGAIARAGSILIYQQRFRSVLQFFLQMQYNSTLLPGWVVFGFWSVCHNLFMK